jgi:hypothetical protein
METSGQLNAPASLPQGKEPARYPLDRRLGGHHCRFRRCVETVSGLQEVLGRINLLLPFDKTQTTQKTKQLLGNIQADTDSKVIS